jgi:hypothetical protein
MVQFFGSSLISFDIFSAELDNYGYQKVISIGSKDYNKWYVIPRLLKSGKLLENSHVMKEGVIL